MARWLLVLLAVCACGGGGRGPARGGQAASADAGAADSDQDGLCDSTETQLGTDPHAVDSDGDGLPDLIELGNGFDPTDPTSPAADQVGYLQAQPGAQLDFQVRITVDGDGQGLSGVFEPISSIYGDGVTAGDFLVSEQALAADPADTVRSIDTSAVHFTSVLGHARLAFGLSFRYPDDGKARTCAKAYPYRYGLKADDGSTQGQRTYLLSLTPDATTGKDVAYCLPLNCQ